MIFQTVIISAYLFTITLWQEELSFHREMLHELGVFDMSSCLVYFR